MDYIESVLGPPPPRPSQADKDAANDGTATPEQRSRLRAWREYWAQGDAAVEEAFKGGATLDQLGYQNVEGKGKTMWNKYGPEGLYSAYGGGVSGNWVYDWLRGRKKKKSGLDQSEGWIPITNEERAGYGKQERWQGNHPGASYRDYLANQGIKRGVHYGHYIPQGNGTFLDPGRALFDQYFNLLQSYNGYRSPWAGLNYQANLPSLMPGGGGSAPPSEVPGTETPGGGTPRQPNFNVPDPFDKAVLWPDFMDKTRRVPTWDSRMFDSQGGGGGPANPGGPWTRPDPRQRPGGSKAILWPDFAGGREGMNSKATLWPDMAFTPPPLMGQINPQLEVARSKNMGSSLFPAIANSGGIGVGTGYDMPSIWANYGAGGAGFPTSTPNSGFDANRFDAFSNYSKLFPSQGENTWGGWEKMNKDLFGSSWNKSLWGGSR